MATDAPTAGSSRPPEERPRRGEETLVIIGNGMAGYKLCERLTVRAGKARQRIVVFGEEPTPAYDRVNLTKFLQGRSRNELLLAPAAWYSERGIELHVGDPVAAIDRDARIVRSVSRKEIKYDRLVFATGSRAFVPPIEGRDLPGVFVYRTLDDLERIKAWAQRSKRAAVLGGGLLGLEAAKALQDLGAPTWIIERGTGLLVRQLDPKASALLLAEVTKMGLKVCTGRETERIERLDDDLLLQFDTGECLRAQMVVIAAGIRPRDELAAACGLKLGPRGGIEVDDELQTSDPRIYAIGECASHRKTIYGLAAPAYRMADALAATLLGRRGVFRGADLSTTLKLPGVSVSTLGNYQADGDTLISETKEGYRRLVFENGRLVGAASVGTWPELPRVQELVERRARVWRWRRERFARTGTLWGEAGLTSVATWPANAIVCNCMGVRRAALSSACASGCTTVERLSQSTGAGSVCGSCKPLLAELVGAPITAIAQPAWRWLLVGSVVAAIVALIIAFAPAIPQSGSVQSRFRPELLWQDDLLKQITGFSLVGIAAISLLLSARKRIKKFSLGEVGHWRAIHALLGVVSLVFLVTHTGLRLGQNLNLILMLNFLALALVGALAGAVTALERRLDGLWGRRLRALWTGCHLALVWPLPALILFHVIAAYYF